MVVLVVDCKVINLEVLHFEVKQHFAFVAEHNQIFMIKMNSENEIITRMLISTLDSFPDLQFGANFYVLLLIFYIIYLNIVI